MTGVVLFQTALGDADAWLAEFRSGLPDDEFRVWPDIGDPSEIEFVIAWNMPVSAFAEMTNLRGILVMGAGVSHLRPFDELPDVPIVRLVDTEVARDMAAYAVHWVIHFHRGFDAYAAAQRERTWERQAAYLPRSEFTVGVLGLGNIGRAVSDAATALGYRVVGWSRSGAAHGDIEVYSADELGEFLGQSHALVNVLPLTAATRRLLGAERLAQLPAGAVVINIGRGGTIDDEALFAALDTGHVHAAVLDAFRGEPLAPDSPMWDQPGIVVTPHISGSTFARSAARYIIANIARIRAGEEPFPVFDRKRGY